MIISCINLKGGVGKTTVAVNLAVIAAEQGNKTLLIDTDTQQGSASQWYKTRIKNEKELNIKTKINLFSINSPEALQKQIDDWQDIFDCIIIDGVPQTNEITIVTISISDIIILPVQPSPFDLWGVDVILAWIKKARMIRKDIKVFFVINRGSTLTNISQESIELYRNLGHQVAQTMLINRVAYAEAALGGLAVTEYTDREAAKEMKQLYEEIITQGEVIYDCKAEDVKIKRRNSKRTKRGSNKHS